MNNFFLLDAAADGAAGGMGISMIISIVAMLAVFYFMLVLPQKKEQKKIQEMHSSMEVGDVVVTTSGFYGIVISIQDDDCIVEFGNNKNCRIPMRKSAIAEVEKVKETVE